MAPNFVVTVEEGNWSAFISIDTLFNGTSSGGLRIADNIDISEVRLLSREMTLKFSFIGLPRGGAKSGMRTPEGIGDTEKRRILTEFGRKISAIIHSGIYYPGMDMNCSEEDLRALYMGAGIRLGKMTDSSYFTALSVENSILACSSTIAKNKEPLNISIEGFGSVAAHLAARLDPSMFRIVSLSTVCGGIEQPDGFSVPELLESRKKYGDSFVEHLPGAKQVDKKRILYNPVDILIPSARTLSIRDNDAENLNCRFIVPAANAPYTEGAIERLHQRGTTCLPGFVVNCGGVFASSMFDSGVTVDRIQYVCATYYRDVIGTLIRRGQELNKSPIELATEIALKRCKSRNEIRSKADQKSKLMKKAFQKGIIPRKLYARYFERAFSENLRNLKSEIAG